MSRQLVRVLLVEDGFEDAELITHSLARAKEPFAVVHVPRLAVAMERLAAETFNVVLADLMLPDSQGLETVSRLRAARPRLPIIVLTGLDSDEVALQSLDAGAQDYLVKGNVTTKGLCRAIRYAIQRQQNSQMRRLLASVRASKRLLAKKNRRLARLYKTAHRFVDNVSHEFRTPLTVIKEYGALLRDGIVGDITTEQAEMLDILEDRADDLNNMVDDMLDMSKLEAGLLCTWRKKCRVQALIERIRPNLERKAMVKNVALETHYSPTLAEVYCDAEKIGRVIINLCINAIKFCGADGRVKLWAEEDRSSRDIVVGVTDSGPGINPADLAVIFDRFKQLHANPRGSSQGFGLGLNIAKELVDLNFGQMRVASQPGKGSTFSFTIPRAEPVHIMRRYLERLSRPQESPSTVSLLIARIEPRADAAMADDVDAFFNWVLRRHDLIFRLEPHAWLLVLPTPEVDLNRFIARVAANREETNRNRPHGALPKIEMETNSIWRLNGPHEEILAHVETLIQSREMAHVCA